MSNRALLTTGIVGTVLAALCCATPILAIVFGAIGLSAWLSRADYVLVPALLLFLGLLGLDPYRRRIPARTASDPASSEQGVKS